MKNAAKFMNRELSWLSFNERVLQEAADPTVPLIERLKFLGIYSSNLDEFYRVRVGSLKRLISAGKTAKIMFGGTPPKILYEIQEKVIVLNEKFDRTFSTVLDELKKEKIFIIKENQMNAEQQAYVKATFEQNIRPRLVPIMLDSVPCFPDLKNQVIYLAIHLERHRKPRVSNAALIELPADVLPRFVVLPPEDDKRCVIMLDDIIRFNLTEIFAIFDYDQYSAYTIKLTRDAELDIDDDVTLSFFEKIAKSVKLRSHGQPVRFVYDKAMPKKLLNLILEKNELSGFEGLIPGSRYHNARDFMNFPDVGAPQLYYSKVSPIPHRHMHKHRSLFDTIRERDILLHYPYQSFHYIIDLLREAAIDPLVTSIKITLYRVAGNSHIINALINASRNGKSVTVVIELQARFDEEANIHWTEEMEDEGVHIIHGVPGLKVHSKLFLISRREGSKKVRYANIGTGNFNESTARIYCDHALLTANPKVTKEVQKVFRFLKNNYENYTYKNLIVSPFYMRNRISRLINQEIIRAKAGEEAYIWVKLNSLVDKAFINKLYAASHAGVKIRMVVRGICSLLPGIKGLSENIEVVSIVDKYLEHSRIFIFCNGGEELTFLSSADWMVRNLDNRVEVGTIILDPEIQKELRNYMEIQLKDEVKARIINDVQDNKYKKKTSETPVRTQEQMYSYLESLLKDNKTQA